MVKNLNYCLGNTAHNWVGCEPTVCSRCGLNFDNLGRKPHTLTRSYVALLVFFAVTCIATGIIVATLMTNVQGR